jgi:hypothetical protein
MNRHVSDEDIAADSPPAVEGTLALRRPDTPVTLSELAALKGEALEVIEARVQILETLRKAAIRATSPEDWLPWTLQAASQLAAGLIAYAYLSRQARRFQTRIDELTRLEAANGG